jgi:hypothetical protein
LRRERRELVDSIFQLACHPTPQKKIKPLYSEHISTASRCTLTWMMHTLTLRLYTALIKHLTTIHARVQDPLLLIQSPCAAGAPPSQGQRQFTADGALERRVHVDQLGYCGSEEGGRDSCDRCVEFVLGACDCCVRGFKFCWGFWEV